MVLTLGVRVYIVSCLLADGLIADLQELRVHVA